MGDKIEKICSIVRADTATTVAVCHDSKKLGPTSQTPAIIVDHDSDGIADYAIYYSPGVTSDGAVTIPEPMKHQALIFSMKKTAQGMGLHGPTIKRPVNKNEEQRAKIANRKYFEPTLKREVKLHQDLVRAMKSRDVKVALIRGEDSITMRVVPLSQRDFKSALMRVRMSKKKGVRIQVEFVEITAHDGFRAASNSPKHLRVLEENLQ